MHFPVLSMGSAMCKRIKIIYIILYWLPSVDHEGVSSPLQTYLLQHAHLTYSIIWEGSIILLTTFELFELFG